LAANGIISIDLRKKYKHHTPESSICLMILLKRLDPGFGIFMAVGDCTKAVSCMSSVPKSKESDGYIEVRSAHFVIHFALAMWCNKRFCLSQMQQSHMDVS